MTDRGAPGADVPVAGVSLDEALGVDADTLLAVVGAGGKKSTLYRLAGTCDRAVLTATVRIPIFDDHVAAVRVTADPVAAVRETPERPLGVVPEREREDRYRGYDPGVVGGVADAADGPVLVKADGARTRWLKAPKATEPRLPPAATLVTPVASARVVGEPLAPEHVHRPDRVADVTGREPGAELTVDDVATVLTSRDAGLKDVPEGARVVPLLNMVDSPAEERAARDVAARVLEHDRIDRVVLTCLAREGPVVAVVA